MLQAGKSASTTRWARRASSASALDSPVPDIPVIRTRVSPSKLPRPLQTDRTWSASSPGEASHKHPAQYSAQGSFCDGMDPADSSLVTCGHSQPRLCLLRQSVAW
jgi:hypothetical protein